MKKVLHTWSLVFLFGCLWLFAAKSTQAQVSGVKAIPGDYSSITAAVLHLRTVGVSGPVFLELQPGYNSAGETFPLVIRAIPGATSINSVTISPAVSSTGLAIATSISGPVIHFIGANNIVIDGRPGRTGNARDLHIFNNGVEGNAVSFADGASNNSVTYCVLEGSHKPLFGGVVYFGQTNEPHPDGILLENSGNELSNCSVSGINQAGIGIYSNGSDPVYNFGNRIINNEINTFRRHGISMSNFNSNWVITGNSIYSNNLVANTDVSIIYFGGAISGSVNNVISGNFLGGQALHAGGGPSSAEYVYGINLVDGSFIVENNTVQNFEMGPGSEGWSIFRGISIVNNASAVISGNKIGGAGSQPGSITISGNNINCIGIVNGSCGTVSITNNRIANFTLLAGTKSLFHGIASVGAANPVITGNEIDLVDNSSTGQLTFTAITLRTNPSCPVIPGPAVIDYNLIRNITLSSGNDSASFTGIEVGGTVSELLQLHFNEVYKINVSAPGNEARFAGIKINDRISSNTGNIIGSSDDPNSIIVTGKVATVNAIRVQGSPDASVNDDIIGNFVVNGTLSSTFKGIDVEGGGKAAVTGNNMKDISVSSPGPASMSGIAFNGAVTGVEISTLHNNSIFKINISSSGAEANFAGIRINDRIAANNGNVIGSSIDASSIVVTGQVVNATAVLVNESAGASITDDIIGNIVVNGTISASLKGIDVMGGGNASVEGNQLGDLSVSSPGPSTMIGINFNTAGISSTLSTLHNNTVNKINVLSNDAEASFTGIRINDRISANSGNVIGSASDANSIQVTGKSASANGIFLSNSSHVTIGNDVIANITAIGTLNPGSVNGIVFQSGSVAEIDSNNIHHLTGGVTRGILVQPLYGASTLSLDDNILSGINTTTGTGIETLVSAEASLNLTATGNTVSNWQTGILLASTSTTLQQSFQNNFVLDNQTGFINTSGTPVDASCNWWGDASGPSGAGPGTGNPVGPNVIFSPWATISTYIAVNAGADQTINTGSSKTLTATVTACGSPQFLWSTGATTASITVNPSTTTMYSITVTDNNGHKATDEVTVFVVQGLTVNAGADQELCNGSVVTLTAEVSGQVTDGPAPATPFTIGGTPDQLILNGHIEYLAIGNTMSQSESRINCNRNTISSKMLTVPAGALIKKAWLYWSGSGGPDTRVKLNAEVVYAQNTKTHSRSGGFKYFGARAEVTNLVQSSGNYSVTDLDWNTGSPYCYDNSAYGAWALVVVYEDGTLPVARIHINTEKFKFTFPAGNYASSISGINMASGCNSNARFTIVAFEGDDYKGEGLTIGGQSFGDNNFRGQSGPNLDILSWNIPALVTPSTTTLNYWINAYQSNTIFGPAIEGLFDYVKVLKYNTCPPPPPSISYLWNTGATTQSINVLQPGTYSVRVTDLGGFVARDTVIVTACPLFDPNKCYKLIARHSGKVLEIGGGTSGNGSPAKQQSYSGGDNQKWKFEAVGSDFYKLVNEYSGRSLEVKNASTSSGAAIQQWTWLNTNNQQWSLVKNSAGYYVIKARHSGKVMEVKNASTSNGALILQGGTSGSGTNQQWAVAEVGCVNYYTRTLATPVEMEIVTTTETGFNVRAITNKNGFELIIRSDDLSPVLVSVTDMSGRILTTQQTVPNSTLRMGERWSNGVYFAVLRQGNQRKVVRMVKTN
jgi:hypothetical protein